MDKYTVLIYETRKQQVEVMAASEEEAIAAIREMQQKGMLRQGELSGMDFDVLDREPQHPREYEIFQLNRANGVYAFMNHDYLQGKGVRLDASCYDSVYKGNMEDGMTLESLYAMFNINRPEDFRGHSLSVSDVIVLRDGEEKKAYFVDSIGFRELPGFYDASAKENESPEEPPHDAPMCKPLYRERT